MNSKFFSAGLILCLLIFLTACGENLYMRMIDYNEELCGLIYDEIAESVLNESSYEIIKPPDDGIKSGACRVVGKDSKGTITKDFIISAQNRNDLEVVRRDFESVVEKISNLDRYDPAFRLVEGIGEGAYWVTEEKNGDLVSSLITLSSNYRIEVFSRGFEEDEDTKLRKATILAEMILDEIPFNQRL